MPPKPKRDRERINIDPLPPGGLVTVPVNFAVMGTAHWNREFVANLAAHRARLCKADVVGVRGRATAHKARLGGNKLTVGLVAYAYGFGRDPTVTRLARNDSRDDSVIRIRLSRGELLRALGGFHGVS